MSANSLLSALTTFSPPSAFKLLDETFIVVFSPVSFETAVAVDLSASAVSLVLSSDLTSTFKSPPPKLIAEVLTNDVRNGL